MTFEEEVANAQKKLVARIQKGDTRCLLHPGRRGKRAGNWVEREPTNGDVLGVYLFAVCGVCSHRLDDNTKRKIIERCRDQDPKAVCLTPSTSTPVSAKTESSQDIQQPSPSP